jgi:hypothetical protein
MPRPGARSPERDFAIRALLESAYGRTKRDVRSFDPFRRIGCPGRL